MEATYVLKERENVVCICTKGKERGIPKTQLNLLWFLVWGFGGFFGCWLFVFFFFKSSVCHIIKVIHEK